MTYDDNVNDQIWVDFKGSPDMDKRFIGKQMDIAAQIDTYLKLKGWTQKQLADRAGLRPSQLSKIMAGTANPTLRTITSLEEALEADIIVCPEFYEESLLGNGGIRPGERIVISTQAYRTYILSDEPVLRVSGQWGIPVNVGFKQFESAKNASHLKPTG